MRGPEFTQQEASNVLVVIVARNIERCSTTLVFLDQALQNVVLIELLAAVIEALHDISEPTSLHSREDPVGICEMLGMEVYRDVYPLFLGLLLHFS